MNQPPVPLLATEISHADTSPVAGRRVRVVMVTNIPAPYRLPVYALLARQRDIELHVVFCGRRLNREWNLGPAMFAHTFLNERHVRIAGKHIHINFDVWSFLQRYRPDVVITTGFNPTDLMAYAWTRLHGAQHIAMTDGTLESEAILSPVHRWVRRRVFSHTAAFIGASEGAFRLFGTYGILPAAMFKSHLCANNAQFFAAGSLTKTYDFMFCGRFVSIKNPIFALEIARDVASRLGRRVTMVFVGSGELEDAIRAFAKKIESQVETTFAGFMRQEDLPRWYGVSRVFLFPTQWEPWGVVANEACAAGVPVLISQVAGSAHELVRDGENGFVLPLEKEAWLSAAVRILEDHQLYSAMAKRGREIVHEYSFENAAHGIAQAIQFAVARKKQA